MSDDQPVHEALVRHLNDHDYDAAYALYATGASHLGQPARAHGRDAMRAADAAFFTSFPDHHRVIEHAVVGADAVALCLRITGTNTGFLDGRPPTGRSLDLAVCNVVEVHDGRIVSMRQFWDQAEAARQLGLAS